MYSIAATLYYCLSGKPPENVPRRIIEDEIDDIRLFNKDISELFSKAIMKNLSLNYKDRFSSVNMFKMFIYIECMIKIREKNNKIKRFGDDWQKRNNCIVINIFRLIVIISTVTIYSYFVILIVRVRQWKQESDIPTLTLEPTPTPTPKPTLTNANTDANTSTNANTSSQHQHQANTDGNQHKTNKTNAKTTQRQHQPTKPWAANTNTNTNTNADANTNTNTTRFFNEDINYLGGLNMKKQKYFDHFNYG